MAVNVFSVAVFLVVFRETIEAAIVVAVLLAFIKQIFGGSEETSKAYKSAIKQVRGCVLSQSFVGGELIIPLCGTGLDWGSHRTPSLPYRWRSHYWHLLPRWIESLGQG